MGRPPGSSRAGAAGKDRARPRRPPPRPPAPRRPAGMPSLGRAWAESRAAHVARAESPGVTARGGGGGGAGGGGCRARGGRGGAAGAGGRGGGGAAFSRPRARVGRGRRRRRAAERVPSGWRAEGPEPELERGRQGERAHRFAPLDAGQGVPAAAADRGRPSRAATSELAEASSGRRAKTAARQRLKYVPTAVSPKCQVPRCSGQLGAAGSGLRRRQGAGVEAAGPARPPPEGEGGLGLLWTIPGENRCAGAARRGRAGPRGRPVRSAPRKPGCGVPFPTRLGPSRAARSGARGLRAVGRAPAGFAASFRRGRVFLVVCLL